VSGQYQKTLVFFLDLEQVADILPNPLKLYAIIVKRTFAHIVAQSPPVSPFLDILQSYFEKLPNCDHFIALPIKFSSDPEFRDAVPGLTTLARGIFDCARSVKSLSVWFTNIAIFPRSVALAFGFGNVHFVLDHLDLADFEVVPEPPFDFERGAVTLLEHLKFILANNSFAISGKNETTLLGLDLMSEDGIDLREGLEVISVVESDDSHSDRYAFKLQIEDEPLAATLRLLDCGGCPNIRAYGTILLHAPKEWGRKRRRTRDRELRRS
jgi:hypothetical protein